MNKEKDKILYISDIAVHSNPFELNIDFIKNECKFMDKEDIYKWILEDELKLKDLQHQLEEKDKVIDEAIDYIKNTKNYVYDVKRDVITGELIVNDKIETNTINKTKLLSILQGEEGEIK